MKVFYFCQTGVHTALIAAKIHLGMLPENSIPSIRELSNTNHFGSKMKNQIGEILYVGQDSFNNEVYSFGVFNEVQLGPRSIESLLKICDISDKEYSFVNTMDSAHSLTKLGITLEFLLGNNLLSKWLSALGVKVNYNKIVQTVKKQNK